MAVIHDIPIPRQQLDEAIERIKAIDRITRTGNIETILTAEGMRNKVLKILGDL